MRKAEVRVQSLGLAMNSCLWFFGLIEFWEDFWFWGGGIPAPRIDAVESGGSGDGSPLVGSRGKAQVGCLGTFCTFACNILKSGYRKCVFRYIDIIRNINECWYIWSLPVYITNCINKVYSIWMLTGPTSKTFPVKEPRPTNKTVANDSISQIRQLFWIV